jgi:hypothetical protein
MADRGRQGDGQHEQQIEEHENAQRHGEEGQRCSHCGADHTPGGWRRHLTTRDRLCNACARWIDSHAELPELSSQQRQRRQHCSQASTLGWQIQRGQPPPQRQCLQCGTRTLGQGQHWCRHPVTGEEWLCAPCYNRTKREASLQKQPPPPPEQRTERQHESALQPAAKRQRSEQAAAAPAEAVGKRQQSTGSDVGRGSGRAKAPTAPAATAAAPPAAAEAAQQQPPPQDVFSLLLGAAEQAAAAASGLTADLCASFSALLDTLPPDQQAVKVRGGGMPCLSAGGRWQASAIQRIH